MDIFVKRPIVRGGQALVLIAVGLYAAWNCPMPRNSAHRSSSLVVTTRLSAHPETRAGFYYRPGRARLHTAVPA